MKAAPKVKAVNLGLPASDAKNQKIGVLAFSSFQTSDVANWLALGGLPASLVGQLSEVDVAGGAPLGPGETDVLLGVDTLLSAAPGARVVVYEGPSTGSGVGFQALFNRMIDDHVNIISNSFGYCEDQTTLADATSIDDVLKTAAAAGISVFNAAGDSGNLCEDGSKTVGVPADSPNATAVGASSLTFGPGDTYGSEAWFDGSKSIPPTGQGGFGISKFFGLPSYQAVLDTAGMRSVPDVVAPADPKYGALICQADAGGCPTGQRNGGTSLATPMWAAVAAFLNETAGHPLGLLNSRIYSLAGSPAFHSAASMGTDAAHVGLGSPNGDLLALALAGLKPGMPDPSASSVIASFPSPFVPFFGSVPADGTSRANIVVSLLDAKQHIVTGKTVTLTPNSGSHVVISPSTAITSVNNGAAAFTVSDGTVENVTFSASDTTDGITLKENTTVNFTGPPAAAGGIAASPTGVAADGKSSTTITVTLQDNHGRGTPSKQVNLSQGASHSVINGPNPAVTDSSGKIEFSATDLIAEKVNYTAIDVTDGQLPVPGSATVTFNGGTGSPCGAVAVTPAAGANFAFSNFITGFPIFTGGNCVFPSGIAFDTSGNLYVADYGGGVAEGGVYRFGSTGGVASLGNRLNPDGYPNGVCASGLAFSKDGEHLYLARQFCGSGGDVVEISQSDASVMRTLATLSCATGLATDPIGGDLFVSQPCPVAGTNNIVRIVNPESPSPLTEVYATPGFSGDLNFGADGTLYTESFRVDLNTRFVTAINGTNSSNPGAYTYLTTTFDPNDTFAILPAFNVANPSQPPFLFSGDGSGVSEVDLSVNPPTEAPLFTGAGDAVVNYVKGGPDGCAYATLADRVVKIANPDGSCGGTPSVTQPTLILNPR